ncbi:acyl-CoA dehydrogenase C-terminal domain-containing protein [Acinetobacter nosocomialis]|uniref:acyl-CoA dehydrogenase C-terminal domain-containing protein n=1 Tax=Acinetobacter nosocomialis TaxID=106654 RepID=UPI000A355F7C|nr:acyl-CoA dehydrogenase C-terminal domain-containing protein [Acinetobacter nosocomialis]MBP1476963.1 acyl-CoA dehydrogenase C-terminal domain-containing protein [Acinetobacter nosocomialis]MBP1512317.1 acyl-CoA dehydrogenase C-terminal domain-containing protein [Acinetobacter nosocomialis]MBR7717296.1 acyl-CoA dehydrogenase C-terminal domain-containing protein [Acinetobacter nosocomialis]MDH2592966.1 acyl-CoA dehydrogenase C-terminal domain-containing protein [Acinetobacter nosocomialis]OTL
MPLYKAPLRDMQFVLHEMLQTEQNYQGLSKYQESVNRELIDQYLEAAADFCENELAPINQNGDQEGCHLNQGVVTTPKGFKEAYQKYAELGFTSLTADPEYGGQGLPTLLRIAISEMLCGSNWAWAMYPGLSHGAMRTIEHHGTEQQKQKFLTKLISGVWTGTMCLTESHAGSDLGLIRTKAEPNPDGSYSITGEKIFISAGEHDLSENIIHIVLARLPQAPAGTKGISLFIVPKFNVSDDGQVLDRNKVFCSAIEHKMGIHGNATCVLNFDGAKGYLIGPENRGLNCMFTFMNTARIGTAVQGLAASEISFQGALSYAKERLAMRSLSGPKYPEKNADPIIVHPAVRSMLMTQKAFSEGGRALAYFLAQHVDIVESSNDQEQQKHSDELLAFLTPIAKAFLTESGNESAKHGVQVFGGHGFIVEHGMEQIVRDARISTLYEGTTEIQSLDLLARKVLKSEGKLLKNMTDLIDQFISQHQSNEVLKPYLEKLAELKQQWLSLTKSIAEKAKHNPEEIGAASVDYLYFSSYVVFAYLWARMAQVAHEKLASGTQEEAFYKAKLTTAKFFYQKLLHRTQSYAASIESGADTVMELDQDAFAF